MAAPVAWFDITAKDPRQIGLFYADLFGWTLSDSGDAGYTLIDTGAGEGAIGGGIGATQGPDDPGGTIVYVKVDDLQGYLDRVTALGGSVVLPPTPLPGEFGSFALFADPEGHPMGLWG